MNFGSDNLFGNDNKVEIDPHAQLIFVSDLFAEDYVGGAELTTQALIDSSPFTIAKLKASDVTIDILKEHYTKYWIFGNFSNLDPELIPSIIANLKYSVLEYDYKYCKYRSPQKHENAEGKPCDCHEQLNGKMISAFYYGAKSVWWMSEAQQEHYWNIYPFLQETDNTVLSSVFDDDFFAKITLLNERREERSDKYIVLGSNSWIKGTDDAINYCRDNELEFEVVSNLHYNDMLEKLSASKGLVFLPKGWDTCPRIVIEAKLLGLDLVLNDNVQHKDEIWFNTDDQEDTESYLYMARSRFWNGIKHNMEYVPEISGYTTVLNCIKQNYPYEASINSLLGFCDEVVVVDGGSTDGTWERLVEWSKDDDRLVVHREERDWDTPRFALFDGQQKALARSLCTKPICWQQDCDEVVHEDFYDKIKGIAGGFPNSTILLALPVIEYWGRRGKVRMDVNPWKWRMSKNLPQITHGIPISLRRYDENGELYAAPGTDACDYVHKETGQVIPCANFYTQDVHNARMAALSGNEEARQAYETWFHGITRNYPGVHHYSWYNLERKIRTYKNYWSSHWQSLYNITQEDTSENNMFFQRPWSDVTEKDITLLAKDLEEKMGGWIFHTPVDFNKRVPHLQQVQNHPEFISSWIKNEE